MLNNTKPNYEHKKLRHLLNAVFRSVWFSDSEQRALLRDTYFINFVQLVDYAERKQLDKTEYILGIRDSLLELENVRDVLPNLDLVQLIKLAESYKINAAYYLNNLLNKKISTEQDAKNLIKTIKDNAKIYTYGQ